MVAGDRAVGYDTEQETGAQNPHELGDIHTDLQLQDCPERVTKAAQDVRARLRHTRWMGQGVSI